MPSDRKHGATQVQSQAANDSVPRDADVRDLGDSGALAGRLPKNGQSLEQQGAVPGGLHDPALSPGKRKRDILASIEAATKRGPAFDPVAGESWPNLQDCLSRVLTDKGKPRAGGEVKTIAVGCNYRTTLIMPEEGVQVSVVHGTLSDAWHALEHVLLAEDVPWVECSEFATRRAKLRGKKKEEK